MKSSRFECAIFQFKNKDSRKEPNIKFSTKLLFFIYGVGNSYYSTS
ncbi:MAG: hypothetical protein H6578_10930 [Chitinophagales bacterium]|nr:hypothetical protein [Chitinophagales bacterium]